MRKEYVSGDEIGRVPLISSNKAMTYLIGCKGMRTYGDLLKVPAWELRSYFKDWHDYALVRNDVHARNYSLSGEHLMLGLSFDRAESEKLADTKLLDCYLPVPIYNVFTTGFNRSFPIETVGDLLIVPYDEILNMRGMGSAKLKQLNEFVHRLGTCFYGDTVPVDEMADILRNNGIMPIEDLDVVPETKKLLHANGIHSVGDALRNSKKIAGFEGFGYQRLSSLSEQLSLMSSFENVCDDANISSIDVIRESWDPMYPIKYAMRERFKNQNELTQACRERDELTRRLEYINARINFLNSPLTNQTSKQYVKTDK